MAKHRKKVVAQQYLGERILGWGWASAKEGLEYQYWVELSPSGTKVFVPKEAFTRIEAIRAAGQQPVIQFSVTARID